MSKITFAKIIGMKSSSDLGNFLLEYFISLGVSPQSAIYFKLGLYIFGLAIISLILLFIGRNLVLNVVHVFSKKTKTKFDDILVEHRVFYRISFLLPVFAFYLFDELIFEDFPKFHPYIEGAINLFLLLVIVWSVNAFLNALKQFLETLDLFKNKPINSYIQLLKIIVNLIALIFLISIFIGKSPLYLLTGLGAISAVLILVFKDTILGFVASLQIAANDMVRVGDWVSLPKYGADGDVLEINLVTIKVKNWDNTISTVPTYAFITDSFKNWRGMQESGGRRIKRALNINLQSVKFADQDLIDRLKKIQILKPYLEERLLEIEQANQQNNIDTSELANGRRLTNIGVFRKYANLYINRHPMVNTQLTSMVRQLEPTPNGIPLEIYCFSKDKNWVAYEGIQADIFDHLMAVAPKFDLDIFQSPSGKDFRLLKS